MVRVIGYDAVNLFAGAGGWDVAARNLGIRTLGFELWKPAVETQRAAGLDCQQADVRLCSPLDDSALTPGFIASPPCQTFSIGGKGAGRKVMDDIVRSILLGESQRPDMPEGAQLILEPLRWIQSRLAVEQPYRWIAMEQVPTCLPIWQAYAAVLARYGYNVAYGALNAHEYGTPQSRKRAVLTAHWQMPVQQPKTVAERVGFAEALELEGDWTLVSNYTNGGSDVRGVRHSPAPAFTLTGRCGRMKLMPGHVERPSSTRGVGTQLTVSQCGVLQGFSPWHPWRGTANDRQLLAGNAVPVQLAQAVLSAVAV